MLENIIQHQIKSWDSFAKESLKYPGISIFTTGINLAMLNLVILENQNIETVESVLPEAQDFFVKHNVPWGIQVIEDDTGKAIISSLKEKGLNKIYTLFHVGAEIDTLPKNVRDMQNIQEVENNSMWQDWLVPIENGFEMQTKEANQYCILIKNVFNKNENNIKHFVLYDDGKPVSSASLTIYNDTARLENVATIKDYKNQGFGKKIIHHVINEARNANAKYITFESSEAGINFYKKFGFQKIATSHAYGLDKI